MRAKVLWFILIFGPIISSPLGAFADTSLLAAVGYFLWNMAHGGKLHKSLVPFLVFAALITMGALVNTLLLSEHVDSASSQAILRPAKAMLVMFGAYFAVIRLSLHSFREKSPDEVYITLLRIVYFATVLHACIILLQYIFPSLLAATYRYLGGGEVLDINKKFRMPGLAGAGGAQLAATQGLGFLIGTHLLLGKGRWLTILVGNLLLVFSLVLTGRTGFVLVGLGIVYWIASKGIASKQPRRKTSLRGVIFGVLSLPVAVGIFIVGAHFFSASYSEDIWFARAVDRTFESITTYVQSGTFSNRTLDELASMYNFPGDPVRWLIGEARLYDNTLGVYYSDIGYVRQWWGYGLVGLLCYVAFYLWMAVQLGGRKVRKVMGLQNVAFGFVVLAAIFILNYKESFFFSRMSYQVTLASVMALHWLTVIDKKKSIMVTKAAETMGNRLRGGYEHNR